MELLSKALHEMPQVTFLLIAIVGGVAALVYLLPPLLSFLGKIISANWKVSRMVFTIMGFLGLPFGISLCAVSSGPDIGNGIVLGAITIGVSIGLLLTRLLDPPAIARKD